MDCKKCSEMYDYKITKTKEFKKIFNRYPEIEWFDDDGCLGGQRGLVFNLKTNTITKQNGIEEQLSNDNINDVKYCIEMNIKLLNEEIINTQLKLNQTEIKYIEIYGGYKISEPLNDKEKSNYQTKLNDLLLELELFNRIKFLLCNGNNNKRKSK
jgi:hypothetical protein